MESNNLEGRLPDAQAKSREMIEEAIALLLSTNQDMAEISIRIEQAVRRAAIVSPVLVPAIERVAGIREKLSKLHGELSAYWHTRQSKRWE